MSRQSARFSAAGGRTPCLTQRKPRRWHAERKAAPLARVNCGLHDASLGRGANQEEPFDAELVDQKLECGVVECGVSMFEKEMGARSGCELSHLVGRLSCYGRGLYEPGCVAVPAAVV